MPSEGLVILGWARLRKLRQRAQISYRMATRPQFKVQPSLPLPWYRGATEMSVYMCMSSPPPPPFVSKRVILFICAHAVPLSLPLLCLMPINPLGFN